MSTKSHHNAGPQPSLQTGSLLRRALGLFALCLMNVSPGLSAAEPAYVPPQLEPWVDWVLHKHPKLNCPRALSNGTPERCVWVNQLDLAVTTATPGAATFDMNVRVFAKSQVELPGNATAWPHSVRVNGQPATLIGKQRPRLLLPAGNHTITGAFSWQRQPTGIQIPTQFGVLSLRVDDKVISRPNVRNGQLVLNSRQSAPTKATRDSLTSDVYRLIVDDYPLQLVTTLDLEVGGRARLITLGQALPDGFVMTNFESDLPARLDDAGNLLVQVTPGNHEITVAARARNNPLSLTTNPVTDNWPKQEIWSFVPQRGLRLVNITGPAAIDLAETNAPFDNDDAQGYLMNADSELRIEVVQRGNPTPPPNQYSVTRQLWLNFDGSGYVVNDQINATIKQASRISANYPLGRIDVDGEAELVNSLAGSEPGIEMQIGDYEIEAFSDLARTSKLSATGWNIDTQALQASLNLPPGWRLLWAKGADNVRGAWFERWSLWDVFLVVFATVLAARFLTRVFAALLAVALILIVQSEITLAILWLVAVGAVAALRYITHERFKRYFSAATWLWLGITLLVGIEFAVDHAREAVYPQLEKRDYVTANYEAVVAADAHSEYLTGSFTGSVDTSNAAPQAEILKQRRAQSASNQQIEEIVVTASMRKAPPKYNEDTQIQTGPGEPNWNWNRAHFSWNGPVSADQTLTLTLASPGWVRLGSALCAVLALVISALLVLSLLGRDVSARLPAFARALVPGLCALALLGPSVDLHAADAQGPLPSQELLTELEQRLLEAPDCFPDCASLADAKVSLDNAELVIELTYHSGTLISAPLLTSQAWSPTRVTIAPAQNPQAQQGAVLSGGAGALQIALPEGAHQVRLSGPIDHLDRFELGWPMNPAVLTTNVTEGWTLSGVARGRIARGAISFERTVQPSKTDEDDAKETLAPDPADAFVTIKRTFYFGLEWTVQTEVRRAAPTLGSFRIQVPLLPGEAVIDADIAVDSANANLEFGRRTRQFQWRSRLEASPELTLTAGSASDRREHWVLLPSNLWHLEYSGLVPVFDEAARGPAFRPYEGETLMAKLTATTPIPGTTVTVDRAVHRIEPGDRQQSHTLELSLRASLGGSYQIELPSGDHTLIDVRVDGEEVPLSLTDNRLVLPQTPGATDYEINWTTNRPINEGLLGVRFKTHPPTLATAANNVETQVEFPRDRWVLFLGGPVLGPAMLFWGFLAVVITLSLVLVRIPGLPLTRTDAVLLSLGLSLCNLPATLLVALWLLLLRFRNTLLGFSERRWLKNTLQVFIGLLSAITLFLLVSSVHDALLDTPDMQITGNGSTAYFSQWFNDHSTGQLNDAWVVSRALVGLSSGHVDLVVVACLRPNPLGAVGVAGF